MTTVDVTENRVTVDATTSPITLTVPEQLITVQITDAPAITIATDQTPALTGYAPNPQGQIDGKTLVTDSGGYIFTDASPPGDHGSLTGRDGDDHTHYHTDARHALIDHTGIPGVGAGGGGGVTDHGALTGLADDDHTQYHTDARHAAIDHTGIAGAEGPQGPPGPAGGGSVMSLWEWRADPQTSPITGDGRCGVDTDAVSSATQFLVTAIDTESPSVDYSQTISQLSAGDAIYLQDRLDSASFHLFRVTGDPTLNGNTWTVPVITEDGSPPGTEPPNATDILVLFEFVQDLSGKEDVGVAATLIASHHDVASTDHDDRYYTEGEVDTALSGKSDTSHDHAGAYDPSGTAAAAVTAHEGAGDPHTQYHDDTRGDARYFTQAQVTSSLAGKENTGVAAAAITSHHAASSADHDDRYYTEGEMTTLLAGKENTGVAAAAVTAHEGAGDPHAQYVQAAGDDMTGNLVFTQANPKIIFRGDASFSGFVIQRADQTRRFVMEADIDDTGDGKLSFGTYDGTGTGFREGFFIRNRPGSGAGLFYVPSEFVTAQNARIDGDLAVPSGAITQGGESVITGDGTITRTVSLTQAAYDLLTPDANTHYLIVG